MFATLFVVCILGATAVQAIPHPFSGSKAVCFVYSDPFVQRFHDSTTTKTDLNPGFYTLLETKQNFCAHIMPFAVYTLIGEPTYVSSGIGSPVAAIITVGDKEFWLTRTQEAYTSTGPVTSFPMTVVVTTPLTTTTVTIETHTLTTPNGGGSARSKPGLRLHTSDGLDVRVFEWGCCGTNYGRVEVHAMTMLQVCGDGLCKGGNGIGRKKRATAAQAKVSGTKEAHLNAFIKRFPINPPMSKSFARVSAGETSRREATGRSKLQLILEPTGPFAKCHNQKNWNAQDQFEVAVGTVKDVGTSDEGIAWALQVATLNCQTATPAGQTGQTMVSFQTAVRRATSSGTISTGPDNCPTKRVQQCPPCANRLTDRNRSKRLARPPRPGCPPCEWKVVRVCGDGKSDPQPNYECYTRNGARVCP